MKLIKNEQPTASPQEHFVRLWLAIATTVAILVLLFRLLPQHPTPDYNQNVPGPHSLLNMPFMMAPGNKPASIDKVKRMIIANELEIIPDWKDIFDRLSTISPEKRALV